MKRSIIILTLAFTLCACVELWRGVEDGTGFLLNTGAAHTTNGDASPINNNAPFNYPVAGGGAITVVVLELLRRFARKKRIEKEEGK